MWNLPWRSKRLDIKIVEVPHRWKKEDALNLKEFLHTDTGRKMLDNMHYTAVSYVVRGEEITEYRRGAVAGFILFLNRLKDGASLKSFPDKLPIQEEEDDDGTTLYGQYDD